MAKRLAISIIVPVLREQASVGDLIGHILKLDTDGIPPELIVVDGDPSASTIKTIQQNGVITAVSETGRAEQMNRGAALATGDVLLFLHVDTFLPKNAFELIRAALKSHQCVGGAFNLRILSGQKIFRMTEMYVRLRTQITRVPFGDQAIFLRKAYFERIGRYRSIPIMEDVELMTRIRKRGDRICIIPEKVTTSARRWERDGIVRGTARNWMLQVLYCCGVSPERLARYYRF